MSKITDSSNSILIKFDGIFLKIETTQPLTDVHIFHLELKLQ